jgi:hypothetical protein
MSIRGDARHGKACSNCEERAGIKVAEKQIAAPQVGMKRRWLKDEEKDELAIEQVNLER